MVLPVLHACARDAHMAKLVLEVCQHLDGQQDADLLLVHPDNFDISEVAAVAANSFKRVHVECYSDWSGDMTWPKPQNWAWQRVARIISTRFVSTRYSSWIWWEPDALPVRKGWLKELTDHFRQRPKTLFGGVKCFTFSHTTYMNGVGIYPINVIDALSNTSALYDLSTPFDITAGIEVMKSFKSMEPLMQHFVKPVGGGGGKTFTEIPEGAVFVHGCTDGSLHELVMGKRSGIRLRAMPGRSKFYHSGDLGDVIYSLPAMRELGGGEIFLGPDNRSGMATRMKMDKNNAALVLPLLEAQPYIHSAAFSNILPPENNHDLNSMRLLLRDYRLDMQTGYNLARCYLRAFGLALENDEHPWLTVDSPKSVAPVVINRSARYHDHQFRWDRVLNAYKGQCVFIGHPEEHAAFCRKWQCKIPYEPTADLLEAARVIAGAKLFVGNQSSCYAIAEGLKKPAILETCPAGSNTIFNRKDVVHGVKEMTVLPSVRAESRARITLKDALTIVGPADMFTGLGRVTCHLVNELNRHHNVCFHPTSIDRRLPLPYVVDGIVKSKLEHKAKVPRLVISPLLDLRKHIQPGDTVFTMWESTVLPPGAVDTINLHAAQLIVPSSWCATVFSANGVTVPIKIVPLGIDTKVYKPGNRKKKKNDSLVFGAAGRLAHGGKRKGIEDVIQAFKMAFPNGDENAELRLKLFDDCYLPDTGDERIRIWPQTLTDKEMADWYWSLDCFVSLSKGEGWGLHVQEAIACGVPVIAPSYSGLSELIDGCGIGYEIIPATEGYLGHWCQPDIKKCAMWMSSGYRGYFGSDSPDSIVTVEGMANMVKEALS